MDPAALEKCRSRLRVADAVLRALPNITTYNEFSDQWYVFLTATKNIYTVLEQGAKDSAQSRQWFGAKKAERRADPLLKYMFQARNDDEHGLERVTDLSGRVTIDFGGEDMGGKAISIRARRSGDHTETQFYRDDGGPIRVLEVDPIRFRLLEVHDRNRNTVAVPVSHLGLEIDNSDIPAVGRTYLNYLTELVDEASRLA